MVARKFNKLSTQFTRTFSSVSVRRMRVNSRRGGPLLPERDGNSETVRKHKVLVCGKHENVFPPQHASPGSTTSPPNSRPLQLSAFTKFLLGFSVECFLSLLPSMLFIHLAMDFHRFSPSTENLFSCRGTTTNDDVNSHPSELVKHRLC